MNECGQFLSLESLLKKEIFGKITKHLMRSIPLFDWFTDIN